MDDLAIMLDHKKIQDMFSLSKWDTISPEACINSLSEIGFEFHEYEKDGTYKKLWDQIKIYQASRVYEIHFWGDEIESIFIDQQEQESLQLWNLAKIHCEDSGNISLSEYLEAQDVSLVFDGLQFHEKYEAYTHLKNHIFLDILSSAKYDSQSLNVSALQCESLEELKEILREKKDKIIYTRLRNTLSRFLEDNAFWHIELVPISATYTTSFRQADCIVLTDDILSKIFVKKRGKKRLSADMDLLLKIQNGDYIVHIDHGVWVFEWITKRLIGNSEKEYLEISYKGNDKLFVPITEIGRVTKYIGQENPELTPLSWKIWEKKLKKVHEDIREIAEGILTNFAERKLREGPENILNKSNIEAFQSKFPYTYTLDQDECIEAIFTDMQSARNMDRLLVWDVGFWKTEVAFNAAFLALQNNTQVYLISPLVVLAHEHYEKAEKRFSGFGYKVALLTRLQSQKEVTQTLKEVEAGKIHLVIGTHRLLSEKIKAKNLWLLIVDEEHKFGVSDKEKIKAITSQIDILSLSATPIPRSLNLALSGVRDISLLKTPPSGRKSIETSVLEYNEWLIEQAGKREFARGGQVFFVHNRVKNIEVIKKQLEKIFPKKKIIITHGQLPGEELELRILAFKNKEYDILLSTTVIENGIDFSNVNTIFINDCWQFGISQIHQLRGRVGRSDLQGYCYLLYKAQSLDAETGKRLQTIVDYSYLWAWFELAMKDLEIRWWWDILGVRQSGQAREIGVSLFLKMLEEKIEELKQEKKQSTTTYQKVDLQKIRIDLDVNSSVPNSFFYSETDKLQFYRELELIQSSEDIEYLETSIVWENPKHNSAIQNIFMLLRLKLMCHNYQIVSLKTLWDSYQLDFKNEVDLELLKSFLQLDKDVIFRLITPHRLRAYRKGFANDQLFIEYLLRLFSGKLSSGKIKLKKKSSYFNPGTEV